MTLYMIGIGLWDEKDITVKGLEAVKKCDKVFLESYTSKLGVPVENLEKLYGQKILLADRNLVEKNADEIIKPAKSGNVAFLVIGDVFGATTHTDLMLRAKEEKVKVDVINNASVMNAIGVVGLELYKFGKTTSIPYHPAETPYNVLRENQASGLHTLLLLDIHADKEKYMTIKEAIGIMLAIEETRKEKIFTKTTLCVGVARLGSPEPKIMAGTAEVLAETDFGAPLHCLIVPGKLHFIEEDALASWVN